MCFLIMCLDSLSEKPCIKSIMVGLDILCKKIKCVFYFEKNMLKLFLVVIYFNTC